MNLKLSKNHHAGSKAWQVLTPLEKYNNNNGIDTVWGLGANNFNVVAQAVKQNKSYLFTDMPYWNRYDPNHPNGNYHWRVCVNNVHVNHVFDLPNDRSKHIQLKEWKTSGEYVLVVPSSPTIHRFISKPNWLDQTLNRLKHITDLPIKVRNKPRRNGTSGPHVADVPLNDDLAQAKFVETSCSLVGVESVIQGIPTWSEPQAGCAPVSNTDLSTLEPVFPDRQQWLNTLSYHQWTAEELSGSLFVDTMKNLYPRVFS